jgi:Ca-activated chloride channel family protein
VSALQGSTAQFVQSRLLSYLTVGVSKSALKMRMALLVIAVALVLLTLARPLWGEVAEEVRQRGLDIVVAIDTSRSMLAEDVAPNRLARAKLAALDLMRLAKHDRLGLVAFAGTAFANHHSPWTREAFQRDVQRARRWHHPTGGTALTRPSMPAYLRTRKPTNFNLVLITDI